MFFFQIWFHEIFPAILPILTKVWCFLTVFEVFWLLRFSWIWKRWPFWNFSGQFRFTGNIINGSRLLCGCQTCLLLFWWRISYSVTNSIYFIQCTKCKSPFEICNFWSNFMSQISNFDEIYTSKFSTFQFSLHLK